MDETRELFQTGRRRMIDAFVALSDAARRAGIDEDTVLALHVDFFDGNVEVKRAFLVASLLAEM